MDFSPVRITFTEPLVQTTVRYGDTVQLVHQESGELVDAHILSERHYITLDPKTDLIGGDTYTLTLEGLQDFDEDVLETVVYELTPRLSKDDVADLNPPIPYAEDTDEFHACFRAACAAHNPTYYERFKKWADDYFYIPHRGVHRGVGGIFYDHLECEDSAVDEGAAFDRNLAFTKDVGEAFLDIFPRLVRRRMDSAFTAQDKQTQLEWRGRYAEFNLVYDRGTLFGLKTGGNIDAILMSLPPEAVWS